MKISYFTDLHGDLEALRVFGDFIKEQKDLGVIACGGDLAGPVLDEEQAANLGKTTQILLQVRAQNQIRATLEQMVEKLPAMEKCSDKLKETARTYSELNRLVKSATCLQYEQIKRIFDSFEFPVILVPGNWDTINIDDHLAHQNLHNKHFCEINSVKFAGYGSSSEIMIGFLPYDLELPFSSKEASKFLSKQDPDVALVHVPPFEYCDVNPKGESTGDLGIANYVHKEKPNLVLCGHTHRVGIVNVDDDSDTVVLNAGNLGRYIDVSNFGTFAEINLDEGNKHFLDATFYQIKDLAKGKESVVPIAKFHATENGLAREVMKE